MRGRAASAPPVRIGNTSATGDLHKNIIRRYVRRKLPTIRGCYERQLLKVANLGGTVVVNFQINGNGKVEGAIASGVPHPAMTDCIAAAIKRINFPKPKGGGIVNVRYPFLFGPTGG
jgi:TonB family protein